MFRLLSVPILVVSIHAVAGPTLSEDVRQLRASYRHSPTTSANLKDRQRLVREWFDAFAQTPELLPNANDTPEWVGWIATPPENARQAALCVDRLCAILDGASMGRQERGWLEVESSGALVAAASCTLAITYHAGSVPLVKGDRIVIRPFWTHDWGGMQHEDPARPNYITLHYGGSAELELQVRQGKAALNQFPFALILVRGHAVRQGETIRVILGDTSRGSPGLRVKTHTSKAATYSVQRTFMAFQRDLGIKGTCRYDLFFPPLEVIGGTASRYRGFAPTIVRPGRAFTLVVQGQDPYLNPSSHSRDEIGLVWENEQGCEVHGRTHVRTPSKGLAQTAIQCRLDAEGVYWAKLTGRKGHGISNPVVVSSDAPRVFWGDVHTHTRNSDGWETPREHYRFARDVAHLDFCAITDHAIHLSTKGWAENLAATEAFQQDGRFVTFFAYEWSGAAWRLGGHHNVYSPNPALPLFSVGHMRYFNAAAVRRPIARVYEGLKAGLPDRELLVIPHGHAPGNWNFHDPGIERLVEIYSKHGGFEWLATGYLNAGHKVGIIAASDDHTGGHPGDSPAMWNLRGGLTAVEAREKTRAAIWDGWWSRHAYGDSGARMYLRFQCKDQSMGGTVPAGKETAFRYCAAGGAPLDRIDLIYRGHAVRSWENARPTEDPVVEIRWHSFSDWEKFGVKMHGTRDWHGRIAILQNHILGFEALNLDSFWSRYRESILGKGDVLRVKSRTHGDWDGVRITLAHSGGTLSVHLGDFKQTVDLQTILAGRDKTFPLTAGKPGVVEVRNGRAASCRYREGTFVLKDPEPGPYYLKVTQTDLHTAWSSPIWLE